MATDLSVSSSRDVTIRAAEVFDSLRHEIDSLEKQLHEANTTIERRNARIEVLEQGLQEAFVRVHRLENDRDLAVNERDEMRLIFYSFKTQLDALVIPLEAPPAKRKRNGKESKHDLGDISSYSAGVDNSGSGEAPATGTGSN